MIARDVLTGGRCDRKTYDRAIQTDGIYKSVRIRRGKPDVRRACPKAAAQIVSLLDQLVQIASRPISVTQTLRRLIQQVPL